MSTYTIPNVIAQHPRGERIMDVYSHLLTERIVYLGTPIDPGVANALIEKGNSGTDPAQRQKDYCTAAKMVWSDAPWIFLYNQKFPIVTTSKVANVGGLPNEKFVTTWASPA